MYDNKFLELSKKNHLTTYTEKNGGSAWISRGSDGPNMMIDYRTAF